MDSFGDDYAYLWNLLNATLRNGGGYVKPMIILLQQSEKHRVK